MKPTTFHVSSSVLSKVNSPWGCWDSWAVMSAGNVISQLLCLSHAACGSLRWPCNDKVASLAAQWDTALLLSPIMKYISLLHLCGITLSLVRRIYQEGPHFSVWRGLPPPLVQTQLFRTESSGGSLLGHLVRHPWNMTAQSMRLHAAPPRAQRPFFWRSQAPNQSRAFGFEVTFRGKKNHFSSSRCIKKISSFLSVFCLGMSRGVLRAQQWPQDREALEESAKTHTAARLRLRRPSGGSLWPPLSLCKNQCSPMMCYVKFPEAWFKWLDILHASLVILQCIGPESTWTPHEKQM